MEEIDAVARACREVVGLAEVGILVESDKLYLPLAGDFLVPSATDGRGRAPELVGDTVLVRAGALVAAEAAVEGLADVDDDKDGLAAGAAGTFGAIEARLLGVFPNSDEDMLLAIFGTMAGLNDEADDVLAAFLMGEAEEAAVLGEVVALGVVDLTVPAPNVPELIIYPYVMSSPVFDHR
jgi:hypothetical protein